MSLLDEMMRKISSLPEAELSALISQASAQPVWVPNPGPQTSALNCLADELFYGGQAGGGKTDLTLGAALTRHKKSLLLRRYNKDAEGMADRMLDEILKSRYGWVGGNKLTWRRGKQVIEFGGCLE